MAKLATRWYRSVSPQSRQTHPRSDASAKLVGQRQRDHVQRLTAEMYELVFRLEEAAVVAHLERVAELEADAAATLLREARQPPA